MAGHHQSFLIPTQRTGPWKAWEGAALWRMYPLTSPSCARRLHCGCDSGFCCDCCDYSRDASPVSSCYPSCYPVSAPSLICVSFGAFADARPLHPKPPMTRSHCISDADHPFDASSSCYFCAAYLCLLPPCRYHLKGQTQLWRWRQRSCPRRRRNPSAELLHPRTKRTKKMRRNT